MKIVSAEFVTSVADIKGYATVSGRYECPEICVVGRSNVGKSTFINCITGRKNLAKTSATPGRTRLLNFFDLNGGKLMLVDLPGYGFASGSKSDKKSWAGLIEGYLEGSRKLARVFSLVDIRHEPTELDKRMLEYLYAIGVPFTVVATKADKLSRPKIAAAVQRTATALKVGRDNVIVFSGLNGTGKGEIENVLSTLI